MVLKKTQTYQIRSRVPGLQFSTPATDPEGCKVWILTRSLICSNSSSCLSLQSHHEPLPNFKCFPTSFLPRLCIIQLHPSSKSALTCRRKAFPHHDTNNTIFHYRDYVFFHNGKHQLPELLLLNFLVPRVVNCIFFKFLKFSFKQSQTNP